jgi:hypothetical protein
MKVKTLVYLSLTALVASLSPAAHAQTFSVIYAFTGANGAFPYAGVTLKAGTLYGTTLETGLGSGPGTVYQLSNVGSNWAHSVIWPFPGYDGADPAARVVFGPDNHLYGTTQGTPPQTHGSVFSLTPPLSICRTANCFWTSRDLYEFTGSPDGQAPGWGDLVWDSAGNIYGTTQLGGTANIGTVFKLTKSGASWTETPIYSFTGPDGNHPLGGVILDSHGNLFGTTNLGGLYGYGTVFELAYTNGVGWTETVLYNFQDQNDGRYPDAGLLMDSSGSFYGSTPEGGSAHGGVVFELSPVGMQWVYKVLYSFSGQPGFAAGPHAPLAMDNSGNLYGTTCGSGADGFGSIFKLTSTQKGWVYSSFHDFTDGTDGAYPVSNVTIGTDGTLYGTASYGGDLNCSFVGCGVVWMIKP